MEFFMRKLVLGALAAATVATPALAQDVGGPFTGPRVGAILGWDGLRAGSTEDSDFRGGDESADGLLYGGDIGYDMAFNGAVVGVEGEITGSTAKVENNVDNFGYGRVKTGRDLYLGARVGVLATPTTLAYVKGGYTNARLDLTRRNDVTTDRHYNLDGYRIGAGVEQSMGGKAYVKAEYRYSNYGDARLEYANGTNTDNFSVDTDRHQVVVGAGIRF
jgi:outer membrane immunogenic protein